MTVIRRRSTSRGAAAPDGDLRIGATATAGQHRVAGVESIEGYSGGPVRMYFIGWSPDGKHVAATGTDGAVVLWNTDAPRESPFALVGHTRSVLGLAWHPKKSLLATASLDGSVRLWDVDGGQHVTLCELAGEAIGLAWSPGGKRLAVSDDSGSIAIWDTDNRSRVLEEHLHDGRVQTPRWSADGRSIVTGGRDGLIGVLEARNLSVMMMLSPRQGGIWETVLSPDGANIACSNEDGTVRVWETAAPRELAILEGHGRAPAIAYSPLGDLLASAAAGEITLWRTSDWERVATLPSGDFDPVGGLDFHPLLPILAAKDVVHRSIRCWSLDLGLLAGRTPERASRRYVNAKVVLLGDTGVGKSGLGLVLSGREYAPTDSTHGRNVWVFEPPGGERGPSTDSREVLLWDLAGQPGYRMVHQLHLNEVAVALIVFDARSETDPFAGVKHWTRALAQARRLEGTFTARMRTFLVAARTDRGGRPVSAARVEALVEELGLDGYFETSAKEGWQIPELVQAMLEAIDWELLPTVSSDEILEQIRAFVLEAKQEGRVLVTVDELFREYSQRLKTDDAGDLRADFEAGLGRVEGRGLVRRLRFGDFVLLQPELLDAYASALVQAAKDEPDGLAVIAEQDALEARFKHLSAERIASREQEKLLLIATVEELLRHDIALREPTDRGVDLVFPSQFTRERPDAPDIPGRELTFSFEGALHNVYATLAVRLARSHLFERREMWRNAATYTSGGAGICGIYLRELEEGLGELDLFFEGKTEPVVRRQFETYVYEHLRQRAGPGSVTQRRVLVCPVCQFVVPEDLLRRRRERGTPELDCPACEEHTFVLVEGADLNAPVGDLVSRMHRSADARRDSEVAQTVLKGKEETDDFDVFLCHDSRDKAEVRAIWARLRERGINPWFDEHEIPPGALWQDVLAEQLESVRSAAVFLGSSPSGRWQDAETKMLVQMFVETKRPLIPVILESRQGDADLPGFLRLLHVVDMRKPEPDPFEQLVWGITREKTRL
jgi:WD40 repeat protein